MSKDQDPVSPSPHTPLLSALTSHMPIPPADPAAKSASKAAAQEAEAVYEIERIVGQRGSGAGLKYHIKWVGYGDEHNTWEPAKTLQKGMTKTSFEDLVAGYAP